LFTRDQREVIKAYERCVFNLVFNNRDDHPKNFSFCLNETRQWRLSPAYDLSFAEGPGGEHYMDICGEGRTPAREHLLELASQTDVPEANALQIIDRVGTVAGTFQSKAKAHAIRKATVKKIAVAIEANRSRIDKP
jgi:serine/threonine-protein kinase HipA